MQRCGRRGLFFGDVGGVMQRHVTISNDIYWEQTKADQEAMRE
jgi:hypothetical protein